MNVELFLELADRVSQIEKKVGIQQKLDELAANLGNLATSPGHEAYQQAVSSNLEELKTGIALYEKNLSPRQKTMLSELTPDSFFDGELLEYINNQISENSATLSVSVPFVRDISSDRSTFMASIESARTSLRQLGFAPEAVPSDEIEVGFLVPREIFNNTLDGFIKEANVIKFILDTASLSATGAASEVTLEQLSTSDPYLIFGLDPAVAVMLAGVVTWGLNTWKQTLEIRELKAKARDIPSINDIADLFEDRIKKIVKDSISQEAARLLEGAKSQSPELSNRLERMLDLILQRFERGYNIDLRLPPVVKDSEESSELKSLRQTRPNMVFPAVSDAPVLKLTTQTEGKPTK